LDNKKAVLGQYFTKKEVASNLVSLLKQYAHYSNDIKVLEPSFGKGSFIEVLKENGLNNVKGCEIDPELTTQPSDFFELPLAQKFDLIIGNPPFTKYNVKDSYYYPARYSAGEIKSTHYIIGELRKKAKMQVENAFILKSMQHLSNETSSIAFILPISFFIKNKNKEVKKALLRRFHTIVVYQNDRVWFDEPIPCCFAIFTNSPEFHNKIVILFEDGKKVKEIIDISEVYSEIIPRSFLYKKNVKLSGESLSKFLKPKPLKYHKSYSENNISGSNILERTKIPIDAVSEDYKLAVVRVGNGSVGKAGLVNIKKDVLNDMFYVFDFESPYDGDRNLKEVLCKFLNENREYLLNITFRVGSKSIKKSDVLDFRVTLHSTGKQVYAGL